MFKIKPPTHTKQIIPNINISTTLVFPNTFQEMLNITQIHVIYLDFRNTWF